MGKNKRIAIPDSFHPQAGSLPDFTSSLKEEKDKVLDKQKETLIPTNSARNKQGKGTVDQTDIKCRLFLKSQKTSNPHGR